MAGANVRKLYSGPDYQNLDVYQVNCTYYSALGEDVYELAVGLGAAGGLVSWSTDGNKTWVKQPKTFGSTGTNAQVTATGLELERPGARPAKRPRRRPPPR